MPNLATYSASKSAAWAFTNAARVELKRQGTQVVAVHVGFVDTDLTAGLHVDKVAPQAVATSALDALEHGYSEALVDDLSANVKASLHDDLNLLYPAIEDQFNAAAVS
jgi:short-subunit dehydrogenase